MGHCEGSEGDSPAQPLVLRTGGEERNGQGEGEGSEQHIGEGKDLPRQQTPVQEGQVQQHLYEVFERVVEPEDGKSGPEPKREKQRPESNKQQLGPEFNRKQQGSVVNKQQPAPEFQQVENGLPVAKGLYEVFDRVVETEVQQPEKKVHRDQKQTHVSDKRYQETVSHEVFLSQKNLKLQPFEQRIYSARGEPPAVHFERKANSEAGQKMAEREPKPKPEQQVSSKKVQEQSFVKQNTKGQAASQFEQSQFSKINEEESISMVSKPNSLSDSVVESKAEAPLFIKKNNFGLQQQYQGGCPLFMKKSNFELQEQYQLTLQKQRGSQFTTPVSRMSRLGDKLQPVSLYTATKKAPVPQEQAQQSPKLSSEQLDRQFRIRSLRVISLSNKATKSRLSEIAERESSIKQFIQRLGPVQLHSKLKQSAPLPSSPVSNSEQTKQLTPLRTGQGEDSPLARVRRSQLQIQPKRVILNSIKIQQVERDFGNSPPNSKRAIPEQSISRIEVVETDPTPRTREIPPPKPELPLFPDGPQSLECSPQELKKVGSKAYKLLTTSGKKDGMTIKKYKNCVAFVLENKGLVYYFSGRIYLGDWDGNKAGRGLEVIPDVSIYEGQFLKGKKHGNGTLWQNNYVFAGSWAAGEKAGGTQWVNDQVHYLK